MGRKPQQRCFPITFVLLEPLHRLVCSAGGGELGLPARANEEGLLAGTGLGLIRRHRKIFILLQWCRNKSKYKERKRVLPSGVRRLEGLDPQSSAGPQPLPATAAAPALLRRGSEE